MKTITSGGSRTKVIALGVGNRVDESELRDIASSPEDRNVIRVQDFGYLTTVEKQLRNDTCTRKNVHILSLFILLGRGLCGITVEYSLTIQMIAGSNLCWSTSRQQQS